MIKLVLVLTMLQINAITCFPTSVYIVMRSMGARVSYQTVENATPRSRNGYYADANIVAQISDLTASSDYVQVDAIRDELASGDPLVWCKYHPELSHCVVVYGIDQKSLLVFDPLIGDVTIPIAEMTQFIFPDQNGYYVVLFEGEPEQQKGIVFSE